ncbi:response regulator [Tunturiibacter empetritectus]|uniref:response regulator n=1 Tax=Tunturiibacter empetritectus TaxID=3069691 RepID=UPI003D9ACC33
MSTSHRLRILSLEDDPNDTELIHATLEAEGIDCEVARVDTETAFHTSLEKGEIDLILADYKLPSFDGLSALKLAAKASARRCHSSLSPARSGKRWPLKR